MGLFWAKYARRIFAIVSTTSIPYLAPVSPTEATVDPPSRGSRLDADHPENGVLIPRRFTERMLVSRTITGRTGADPEPARAGAARPRRRRPAAGSAGEWPRPGSARRVSLRPALL